MAVWQNRLKVILLSSEQLSFVAGKGNSLAFWEPILRSRSESIAWFSLGIPEEQGEFSPSCQQGVHLLHQPSATAARSVGIIFGSRIVLGLWAQNNTWVREKTMCQVCQPLHYRAELFIEMFNQETQNYNQYTGSQQTFKDASKSLTTELQHFLDHFGL